MELEVAPNSLVGFLVLSLTEVPIQKGVLTAILMEAAALTTRTPTIPEATKGTAAHRMGPMLTDTAISQSMGRSAEASTKVTTETNSQAGVYLEGPYPLEHTHDGPDQCSCGNLRSTIQCDAQKIIRPHHERFPPEAGEVLDLVEPSEVMSFPSIAATRRGAYGCSRGSWAGGPFSGSAGSAASTQSLGSFGTLL